MKKRQMEMIKMYRNIIRREHFKTEFKKVVTIMQEKISKSKKKNDVSIWRDYTHTPDTYLNKDYDKIYEEIRDVLDTWESYGYLYFIKEGVCVDKRKWRKLIGYLLWTPQCSHPVDGDRLHGLPDAHIYPHTYT